MATYYTLRQQASSSQTISTRQEEGRQLTTLDIQVGDHSIYIFPDPSSAPPSPAPSLFSPATSFDDSLSPVFSPSSPSPSPSPSRPRVRHHASSLSTRSLSISQASTGSSSRSAHTSSFYALEIPSPISPTYVSVGPDSDVGEIWDGIHSPADEEASWLLEERVERVGRWDLDLRLRQFAERASASATQQRRMRLAPLRTRTRTISQAGTNTTSFASSRPPRSASSTRPISPPPEPRIRLPLLSFFAAILSLDLDDPALRLLTQSAPDDADSVLFPGHSAARLLQGLDDTKPESSKPPSSPSSSESSSDSDSSADPRTNEDHELTPDPPPVHGLQKLLSSAHDPSGAALRSLRAGLALASLPGEYVAGVPGVRGLAGLWRVVGEVCVRSGQAWREVWVSTGGGKAGL